MKNYLLLFIVFNFSSITSFSQSKLVSLDSLVSKNIFNNSKSEDYNLTKEINEERLPLNEENFESSMFESIEYAISSMVKMIFRFETQSVLTLFFILFFFAYQNSRLSDDPDNSVWKELKPSLGKGSGFREMLIFVGILLFYKWSRYFAIGDADTAFSNAYRVVNFEKSIGIFYEIPIQQYFLQKEKLIKILNQIYIQIHVPVTMIFFVWLYYKRKKGYIFIRNGFILANVIVLFFFVGFPCAPPRMLNDLGFVDTLFEISGINLYEGNLSKLFNQYAAVPSMHFGNSILIALVTFWLAKSYWVKGAVSLYPWFILLVIVATGNHFFIDAILGGLVVMFPYPLMLFLQKYFPSLELLFWGKINRSR